MRRIEGESRKIDARAELSIFAFLNTDETLTYEIDLHGQHVKGALEITENKLH